MKRSVRILAILSEIIAVLCFLGVLVCIVMQKKLMPLYVSNPELLERFVLPAGPVVYALGLCAILLIPTFLCGKQNTGIWGEILTACLLAVLPGIQSGLSTLQTIVSGQFGGSLDLAAFSAVTRICEFPLSIAHLATTLALLACGMSIAYKKTK